MPRPVIIALFLLAAHPALADNYTHRSSDTRESAAAVPAPEEQEYPSSEPLPVDPVPAPEAYPVPVEPEPAPTEAPPAEPPAPAAAKPSGVLPVSSDFLPKPPPAPVPVPRMEKLLLEGRLPEGAQAEGDWIWAADPAGGTALVHSHLSAKGAQSHRFTAPKPVEMPGNGMVVQRVWLDPQDPPQGIALRFKLASGEEVGVYWEGESEVFTPTDYEELWYHGMLPELGRWVPLEVLAEDLGLEEARIAGISFATFGGRALWGKTILTEAPPLEGEEPTSPAEQQEPAVSRDIVSDSTS